MPYEARKGDGDTWEVINSETKEVKEIHEPPDAEDKAKRQVRVLELVEERFGKADEGQ